MPVPLSLPDRGGVPGLGGRVGGSAVAQGTPAVRLGVLTCEISPALVDEVIAQAGRREQRRRLLPAQTVVYFVLAMCLFSGSDSLVPPGYRSVMRWLCNGLRHLPGTGLVSSSALVKGRQRLGAEPLRLLFTRRRGVLGTPHTPGVFAFGRRLVAWDGTGLDVADTPQNEEEFGRHGGGHPQIRLLALLECGTHAIIDAAFSAITGPTALSEVKLARQVITSLRPGMLLLADRNFVGHDLWGQCIVTGADLLWRIKKNQIFVPLQVLPDGSFTSILPTPAEGTRQGRALRGEGPAMTGPPHGHLVRIIEYTLTVTAVDTPARTETFRLATSILDHELAPARQLAETYHERWENETGYQELKTRLRGAEFILRSKSPDLVRQELFAFLTVYQALCSFKTDAATSTGIDPDRISFTITVRIARTEVTNQAAATPATLLHARAQATIDLLTDLLPPRRPRHYQRIKKAPKNNYPRRKHRRPRTPNRVTYTIKITPKDPPPAQTP